MNPTMTGLILRKEETADHSAVEAVTREAFWNVYAPGCSEHYYVHRMRSHPDFLPELAYVLEKDGKIIGNVMYARCRLRSGDGEEKQTLSMGPICVLPQYQRMGGSRLLLEHTFSLARELGYEVVVNFGNPGNYINRGYQSCYHSRVSFAGGYPTALLVKELVPGALAGKQWEYLPSDIDECCQDTQAVEAFDAAFPHKEKAWRPSQEEFFIYSHSSIVR